MRSELHDPLPARPSPAEEGHARDTKLGRLVAIKPLHGGGQAAPRLPRELGVQTLVAVCNVEPADEKKSTWPAWKRL
ncbi:hypothetical protein [Polyangium fumosum]|uniref:Uncharacterized protein n=1 Tax=Polyangium fumosum TaxID=889272 RepID=A0A4U1J2S2_9BACT|nr:hypothetical protein [Polyangium fumosum]TKD01385.1 hypothetical protein E8A74_31580 [Polyangium fumosum]